ncbi:MAG: hypothetical protein AAF490_29585 [Chloroflexota bacterium]
MEKAKDVKISTVVFLILGLVWFWIASLLLDISVLTFFYFIWLFIGLGMAGAILWYKKFKDSMIAVGVIIVSALLLTPVLGIPTVLAYRSYEEGATLNALDRLIEIIVNNEEIPSNYQIENPENELSTFNSEFSRNYEIIFIDFLLGQYDIGVRFNSGAEYIFQIGRYDRAWHVLIFRE